MKHRTGKIFVSGGGGAEASKLLDKRFIDSLSHKRVVYVPIASRMDVLGYEANYEWIVDCLTSLTDDFVDISMWLDLNGKTLSDLKKFDAIYFSGGNTYKLLDNIVGSGFKEVLIKYHKEGGVIYGGSAGAIVLGKKINTVSEENDRNYKYEHGLNLLDNYSVICHFNDSFKDKIVKYVETEKSYVLALPEEAGVVFDDNGDKYVFGSKPAYVFRLGLNKQIIINPGSRIS